MRRVRLHLENRLWFRLGHLSSQSQRLYHKWPCGESGCAARLGSVQKWGGSRRLRKLLTWAGDRTKDGGRTPNRSVQGSARFSNQRCSPASIWISSPRDFAPPAWPMKRPPLLPQQPQTGFDHPLPQCFGGNLQAVHFGKLLRRQRRAEVRVPFADQSDRMVPKLRRDLPIGRRECPTSGGIRTEAI